MPSTRHIAATLLLTLFVVGGVVAPSMHAWHHAETASACDAPVQWAPDDAPRAAADCVLCDAVFHVSAPSLPDLPAAPRPRFANRTHPPEWAPGLDAPTPDSRGPPRALQAA